MSREQDEQIAEMLIHKHWRATHAFAPPYTYDAGADFLVLCHVRENWDDPFLYFMDALNDLWQERRATDDRFGDQEPWSCYLPGDYSAAALAVLKERPDAIH